MNLLLLTLACRLFEPCGSIDADLSAMANAGPQSRMALESDLLQQCPGESLAAARRNLTTPSTSPNLVEVSLWLLTDTAHPQDLPLVASYLTHTSPDVRSIAAIALKKYDGRAQVEASVLHALETETKLENMVVLAGLVSSGDDDRLKEAVRAMAARVDDGDRMRNTAFGRLDERLRRLEP